MRDVICYELYFNEEWNKSHQNFSLILYKDWSYIQMSETIQYNFLFLPLFILLTSDPQNSKRKIDELMKK